MSNDEQLLARVAHLEESMRTVVSIMSRWSGMAEANSRALEGLVAALAGAPDVRQAVASRLEAEYASQLGESENEISINAFTAQSQVLNEAAARSEMLTLVSRCM